MQKEKCKKPYAPVPLFPRFFRKSIRFLGAERVEYMVISVKDENARSFFAILALGITTALKNESITITEAWNWGLNLHIMEYLTMRYGEDNLENIVHLGTELENVKRIIPHKFDSSCEEIIKLCHKELRANSSSTDGFDAYLTIE